MKKATLILLFAGLGLQAQVDEGYRAFSLEEAKQYASKNAYTITDKNYEIKKAEAQKIQALALSLPNINGSYTTIWNAQIQPQAIGKDAGFIPPEQFPPGQDFIYLPFGTEYQTQWELGASLNFAYANFLARRASKVLMETKNLDLRDAEMENQNEVEKSYYAVLVAQENARLLKANMESLNKNYTETQKLYESGFVEEQSVDQLELLVTRLNNNVTNAERQQELALLLLKFNMGMPQDSAISLSQSLDDFLYVSDGVVMSAESFDATAHIDYKKALTQIEASELSVKNEKSQWLPSINLGVSHTEAYFSNTFDPLNWNTYWAPGTRVTGGLQWNINPLGRPASIQEAKIDAMRSELNKEVTLNQVNLNYQQKLSDYKFALDNYMTQKRNLEISEKIQKKERVKFKEGLSGSLDLTQAENQYLETQQSYVQALLQLLQAKENLDQAMGRS